MANIQQLLNGLNIALENRDGADVASLLDRNMRASMRHKKNFLCTVNPNSIPQLCQQYMDQCYHDLATEIVLSMVELKRNNLEQAYEHVSKSFK